ncbi:hypothetical protein GCM10020331_050340 [Ectobacillus funiculus]
MLRGLFYRELKDAIAANDNKLPTREQVRDAVRSIQNYEGAVTKVGFDEKKGDNKFFKKIYIYKLNESKYPGTQEGEVSNTK